MPNRGSVMGFLSIFFLVFAIFFLGMWMGYWIGSRNVNRGVRSELVETRCSLESLRDEYEILIQDYHSEKSDADEFLRRLEEAEGEGVAMKQTIKEMTN